MIWNSWQEMLAMGGYGRYVWGSLGMVALCLLVEVLALRQRQRRARQALRASGGMQ